MVNPDLRSIPPNRPSHQHVAVPDPGFVDVPEFEDIR
jgi:hypothetical protein